MLAAPRIHALLHKLESKGCAIAEPSIVCEDIFAGASALAAFDSNRHVVVMNPAVPDKFLEQREWTRSIAHELVHAFDYCRADLDVANCTHMACTEVRAANLSGECDFTSEFGRIGFPLPLAGHQQQCVRRRAEKSIMMHPACMGKDTKGIVDDVFATCYADTAPFPTN